MLSLSKHLSASGKRFFNGLLESNDSHRNTVSGDVTSAKYQVKREVQLLIRLPQMG
jgi:hypothetical protein